MPSTRLPAAVKQPANAALFQRPQQIKTNARSLALPLARSAPGTPSFLDFRQLFMEAEGDICCDAYAQEMASLKGAIECVDGGF